MQPTLFGITHEDFRNQADVKFPGPLGRFADYWLRGISYVHVVAKEDGELIEFEPPTTVFPFVQKQRLLVGNQTYTVWFAPDELTRHSGLVRGMTFRRGEDIMKVKIVTGDHLFVDRLSYNFRRPSRGEIIVFETIGIPEADRNRNGIPADQFYIKRLVGLGGETISIDADRHVHINGNQLNAATPHFENLYSFDPKDEVRDRQYYIGHVLFDSPGARLSSPGQKFEIRPRHYVVLGDNTKNSLDSRAWGDFPQEFVIGKSFFVYWPILSKNTNEPGRFGWSVR
jgi:signal peptidase I